MQEETEETTAVPPTVSEDAPSEPSVGEGPPASQPQPVYPDGETGDDTASDDASTDTMSDEASSNGADDTGWGYPFRTNGGADAAGGGRRRPPMGGSLDRLGGCDARSCRSHRSVRLAACWPSTMPC